jgi:chromate transporter
MAGKKKPYAALFGTMVLISLSCFGGGYAVFPLLRRELVEKRGYLTGEELADSIAIAQCTPGIIALNTATFAGARVGGTWGAVCATAGLLLPPIVLVTLVSAFFAPFLSRPPVQKALLGLQVCVCVLVLKTVVTLFRETVSGVFACLLFAAVFALSFFGGVSPVVLVLGAGAVSLLAFLLRERRGD